MNLAKFWLDLEALTNKPEAHGDISVVICTLDGEFPAGKVELTKDTDGNWQLQINTDEPVYHEPWE